ncbi:MAG: hypothetical protein ACFHW5_18165 [Verrucomicrobiota bacterium]
MKSRQGIPEWAASWQDSSAEHFTSSPVRHMAQAGENGESAEYVMKDGSCFL